MEADKTLDATLKALGLPAARGFYRVQQGRAAPQAYFTYSIIFSGGVGFADDGAGGFETLYGVELFSKADYTEMIERTRRALLEAEFYGVTVQAEQYEQDTGYYHVSMQCKYATWEAD